MKAIINLDIVKYPDVVTVKNGTDVLENGAFIALGALENTGRGRDTYAVAKLTEGCRIAYLSDVALQYDETKDERDYECVSGAIARAYRPKTGDAITIAVKHVSGTVAVGDKLEVKSASHQLQKATTGKEIAVVLEKYNFNGQDSLYIEFI